MNYIILIGIALFLLVGALHDGAMGWDFGEGRMDFRVATGDHTLRVRGDSDVDLEPDGTGVRGCRTVVRSTSTWRATARIAASFLEPRGHHRAAILRRR